MALPFRRMVEPFMPLLRTLSTLGRTILLAHLWAVLIERS